MSAMTAMTSRYRSLPRQAGVGLVTAIFLLVVLAGLAVAMVSLYTSQQASSNLDLQGARAYQAARAGLEWGLFRQMRNGVCDGPATVEMPGDGALAGFTVIVRCSAAGEGTLTRRHITAAACNIRDSAGGCNCVGAAAGCRPSANPETVNRQVEAEI
jgi:MSHA biogenesis protein MshP